MKLKYYLRGLGIGIIVTVIIMMIAFHVHGSDMTDEEVIERAKQLGMVESEDSGVVADQATEGDTSEVSTDEAETTTEQSTEDKSQEESSEDTSKDDSTKEDTSKDEKEESKTEESKEDSSEKKSSKTVKVTIESGASSDSISQMLYEKGIVDDAYAFNDYLITNGYANVLRTGSFKLPTGASYKKIAKLLTGE
ncbi:MAG: endolytic transglycosylase MltG [Eubacterium sp.]|nr:endolytic transglycosylase MltG [Eubacterium sp.]